MKHRLLVTALLVVLLSFLVINVKPALADHGWRAVSVTCTPGSITYTVFYDSSTSTSVDVEIALNGNYYKTIYPNVFGATGNYTFTDVDAAYIAGITVTVYNTSGGAVGGPSSVSANCGGGTCTEPDNRMNSECKNADQSVAVYCDGGTLSFYAIYHGKGTLAFRMTQAELSRFPATPARNILIKQAMGVRLYKLSSGQYQVNRAKQDGSDYWFRWEPSACMS